MLMAIKLTHMESIVLHQLARCNIIFITLAALWHVAMTILTFLADYCIRFDLVNFFSSLLFILLYRGTGHTTIHYLPSLCDAEKVTYALCTAHILTILNVPLLCCFFFLILSSFDDWTSWQLCIHSLWYFINWADLWHRISWIDRFQN